MFQFLPCTLDKAALYKECPDMVQRLRHPLIVFTLLGAVIFAVDWILIPEPVSVIHMSDSQRAALRSDLERRADFSETMLDQAIRSWLDEEILVREARRLKLVDDDPIVRRRLAQVMRFYLAESTPIQPPTKDQLQRFMLANPERYTRPAHRSFEHHFFTGEQAEERRRQALDKLRAAQPVQSDAFAHGRLLRKQVQSQLEIRFGEGFAHRLWALEKDDQWVPLNSTFGLHLVRLTERNSSGTAELKEVASSVQKDWLLEQRKTAVNRALESLRKRYEKTP